MGKVTIQFEYDEYEERAEIRRLVARDNAYSALWDVDHSIRSKLKYSEEEWLRNEQVQSYLEELREMIWESRALSDYE